MSPSDQPDLFDGLAPPCADVDVTHNKKPSNLIPVKKAREAAQAIKQLSFGPNVVFALEAIRNQPAEIQMQAVFEIDGATLLALLDAKVLLDGPLKIGNNPFSTSQCIQDVSSFWYDPDSQESTFQIENEVQ